MFFERTSMKVEQLYEPELYYTSNFIIPEREWLMRADRNESIGKRSSNCKLTFIYILIYIQVNLYPNQLYPNLGILLQCLFRMFFQKYHKKFPIF